ncbi:MAG TPA: VWA domain-containing protein, partial [Bacteroidia bacterium]|nr:VWA domain-containing protein [Bacteroidia bacterium]
MSNTFKIQSGLFSFMVIRTMLVLGILFSVHGVLFAQKQARINEPAQQPTRILFLFDASQSMFGRWESDTKFEIAKRLLTQLTDSLDRIKNVETALHVYGHLKKFPPQDCDDNRLEVPFAKANGSRIRAKLNSITPSGTTPIARSLEACGNDFPEGLSRNIIILITDGIEE